MKEIAVSIIFPTLNCKKDAKDLCTTFEKLDISKKAEIIVIDSNSIDGTKEILSQYDFLKVIELNRYVTKGKARNLGIQQSHGDIIINIDSDTLPTIDWFSEIISSLEKFDIVVGFTSDYDNKQLPRVSIYVDGQDITYPACNMAFKRSVVDKIGFFNETPNIAEDIDFNYRCVLAGYNIFYNPHMKIIHKQRNTLKGFMKQAFWNGEARYEFNKVHPELKHSHRHGLEIKNIIRLSCGLLGFTIGHYLKKKGEKI